MELPELMTKREPLAVTGEYKRMVLQVLKEHKEYPVHKEKQELQAQLELKESLVHKELRVLLEQMELTVLLVL